MARGTGAQLTEEQLATGASRFQIGEREEGAGILSTLKTAIMNLPADVVREAGFVGEMILHPLDTGEALLRVAAGYAQKALPDSWEAYLPEDWETNKEYANAINDFYKERYGSLEGAMDAFAENPVSVALDIFIIKSIVTSAAKQSTKIANQTNKVAITAKGTVMEDALTQKAASVSVAADEVKVAADAVNKGKVITTVERYDRLMKEKAPDGSTPNADLAKIAEKNPELKAAIMNDIEQAKALYPSATVIRNNKVVPKTTYPIMNQAQREAKLARDNVRMADEGMITGKSAIDDAVKAEAATGARLAEELAEIEAKMARVEKQTDNINLESAAGYDLEMRLDYQGDILENARQAKVAEIAAVRAKAGMDDAIRAETAAKTAEAGEAVRVAKTTAGDMYPLGAASKGLTTAQAGMMTSLSRIPNIIRPWKKAEIGYPVRTAAVTTKLAELADVADVAKPPVTALGLDGERGADGSLYPYPTDIHPDIPTVTIPKKESPYQDMPPYEKSIQDIKPASVNARPGWYQGSSKIDTNDGNYWSADFEDEYWNTPAGVEEAINVWGRPIGNRIGNPINWSW